MRKIRLALFELSSCAGCQEAFFKMEEIVELSRYFSVRYFREFRSGAVRGRYDIALVEGSVGTPGDAERLLGIRERADYLVALGSCATTGGIQALRNWAELGEYLGRVYPKPEYLKVLEKSTPISDHVRVDFELHGCPVGKEDILEFLLSMVFRKRPRVRRHSVCTECKREGAVCVMVVGGMPCLGPVSRACLGAVCPSFGRDCYSCFGPVEEPNVNALVERFRKLGLSEEAILRRMRGITCYAKEFREVGA